MSSSTHTQPSNVKDYTIGWISALPIELAAAEEMLYEVYPALPTNTGDDTIYTLGRIGLHNVVIASLPGGQTGISAATSVAIRMLATFTSVRVGFMVGVGGGVPSDETDIRLGDVVVSLPHLDHGGVVQYDFGKAEAAGKFRRTGHLNTPPKLLLNVVNKARANYYRGLSTYSDHLSKFDGIPRLRRFTRSKTGPDLLYLSSYTHSEAPTCDKCQPDMLLERQLRDNDELVQIHYGTIASGNQVIKDAKTRDELAKELGGNILCFEMEAAGLMNDFHCLVVRGICDYADSHKQKNWQPYAAATAAAYAKELLSLLPVLEVSQLRTIQTPLLLPFHRNAEFTGREAVLDRLFEYIRQPTPPLYIAVYGLGGCGKSALAVEFAYRVRASQSQRAIFWLPAIDQERFKQAYREIAILYEIPEAENSQKDIMDLVRRKLSDEDTGDWLMIIDNADDPDVLMSGTDPLWNFLPRCSKGTILFTTRSRKVAVELASHCVISLDELSPNEAQDLFRKSIPNTQLLQDEESIATLLEKLTYIPLAIIQAVAFMNSNDTTAKDYLNLLKGTDDQLTAVLSRDFRDHNRYPDTDNPIAKTWYISFHQIQTQDPLAAKCLSFIACIASVNIPEGYLLPDVSEVDRIEAIGTLTGYHFLTSQQDHLFSMHPLVHLATRNWLKHEDQWSVCITRTIDQLGWSIPSETNTYKIYQRFISHAMETINLIGYLHTAESIEFLKEVGDLHRTFSNDAGAKTSYRAVLDWMQENLGPKHLDTLKVERDLGIIMDALGDSKAAVTLQESTLASLVEVCGTSHNETLSIMLNLASTYTVQGRFEDGEKLFDQICEMRKQQETEGNNNPEDLPKSMSELALHYLHHGQLEKAEELETEALQLFRLRCGDDNPRTLESMYYLSRVYAKQGRLKDAVELMTRKLETERRVLGLEHLETLNSAIELAWLYGKQGRLECAERILMEVLEAQTRVLGPEHPMTLDCMQASALLFHEQGRLEDANRTFTETLELQTRVLGLKAWRTLDTMYWLARVNWDKGNRELAIESMERCVGLSAEASGAQDRFTQCYVEVLEGWRKDISHLNDVDSSESGDSRIWSQSDVESWLDTDEEIRSGCEEGGTTAEPSRQVVENKPIRHAAAGSFPKKSLRKKHSVRTARPLVLRSRRTNVHT